MKKKYLTSLIIIIALLSVTVIFSQNPSAPNRTPPPPPGIPIDGGIFGLISIGIVYAFNKLRVKK
jgi:hypothetical protein